MTTNEALNLFLEAIIAEGLSPQTIQFYRHHLQQFINSQPSDKQQLNQYRPSDINAFLVKQRQAGLSDVSAYAYFRSLHRFFNWCEDNDEVGCPPSPMRNLKGKVVVKVKKPARKPVRRATVEHIDALIEAVPPGNWIQRRNRVALRLLRDTGLRVSEAVNIRLSDLNLAERVLTIPKSKNRRARQVRLTKTLSDEIRDFLACRPPCPPPVTDVLFISAVNADPNRGVRGKLTIDGLRQMIKKLCERTQSPHVNPHSIRHMFGTKALNDGIRLEIVSDLMGHHDPSFTRKVYAELLDTTIKREYDLYWK